MRVSAGAVAMEDEGAAGGREEDARSVERLRDAGEHEQAASSGYDSAAAMGRRQRESLDSNAAVGATSRRSVGGREPGGRVYIDDELESIKQSLMLMHEQMEKSALANTKVRALRGRTEAATGPTRRVRMRARGGDAAPDAEFPRPRSW